MDGNDPAQSEGRIPSLHPRIFAHYGPDGQVQKTLIGCSPPENLVVARAEEKESLRKKNWGDKGTTWVT